MKICFLIQTQELLSRRLPYYGLKSDVKIMDAIQKGIRPVYEPELTSEGLIHHHLERQMVELCYRSWVMPPRDRPDMYELIVALGIHAT